MSDDNKAGSDQRSAEFARTNDHDPWDDDEHSTTGLAFPPGRQSPAPPTVEEAMTADEPILMPMATNGEAARRAGGNLHQGQQGILGPPGEGQDQVMAHNGASNGRIAVPEQTVRRHRSRPLDTRQPVHQTTDRMAWPRWLARTVAIILPIALLLAAAVWFGLRTVMAATTPETTTVTRIVLTDQVRWPFFDTVIEEVGNLARSDELLGAVDQAFPSQDYVLEPSVPTAVDAIIDVTVDAEDEALSRDVSVLAARWIIDQHETRRVDEARQSLDPLVAERDRVVEQKAAEEAKADQIVVDRQNEDGDSELARLDRELRLANNAISFYDSELLRLDSAINEVNGSLTSLKPEVDIGSVSSTTSTDGTSSLPFQAGLATFLLAGFGLFVANRELGRFGDSKHLQSVLEVPVVSWNHSQANVQLARLVRMAQDEVACQIVGFDSEVTTPSAVAVSNSIANLGVASQYLRPGVTPTDPDVVYLQAAGDSQLRSDSLKGLVWCDAILLVADSQRDTIRDLRRRLRRYRELGIPPLAIIAVDRDKTGPRYPGSDTV